MTHEVFDFYSTLRQLLSWISISLLYNETEQRLDPLAEMLILLLPWPANKTVTFLPVWHSLASWCENYIKRLRLNLFLWQACGHITVLDTLREVFFPPLLYAFGGVSCLLSPVRLVKQNSWVQTVWCPELLRLNHFSALLIPDATFRPNQVREDTTGRLCFVRELRLDSTQFSSSRLRSNSFTEVLSIRKQVCRAFLLPCWRGLLAARCCVRHQTA